MPQSPLASNSFKLDIWLTCTHCVRLTLFGNASIAQAKLAELSETRSACVG